MQKTSSGGGLQLLWGEKKKPSDIKDNRKMFVDAGMELNFFFVDTVGTLLLFFLLKG